MPLAMQTFRVTPAERAALAATAAERGTTTTGLIREALAAAGVRLEDTNGKRKPKQKAAP